VSGKDLTKDLQGIIPALGVGRLFRQKILPRLFRQKGGEEKIKKYSGNPRREYIPTGK